MKCERCGKATTGYDLHDYCAECSKNLCADCMANGCCGNVPAHSGMIEDLDAEATRDIWEKARKNRSTP